MTTIIINADDFGLNEGRTRAILEFMREGVVSNTTLMTNMPFADQAVRMAKTAGVDASVGLHLNLTQGRPLTAEMARTSFFCTAGGEFNEQFHNRTLTRLRVPRSVRAVLRAELRAQIERYLEFGLTERHLDSHHHAHTDFSVMRELLPLLREYEFKSVRLSANFPWSAYGLAKKIYKLAFNSWIPRTLKKTHYFCQPGAADEHWGELDGACVELMTHPMRCRDGAGDDSDVRGEYETKFDSLRALLDRHSGDYRLVSYAEL